MAPQLLPLWGVLEPELDGRGRQVLRSLKQVMQELKLSPTGWRYLCRLERSWVGELVGRDRQALPGRILVINFMAGVAELPISLPVYWHFIRLRLEPVEWNMELEASAAAVARAAFRDSWQRRGSVGRFLIEVDGVVEWFLRRCADGKAPFAFDSNQRRAPWSWYRKRAATLLGEIAVLPPPEENRHWTSLVGSFRHKGWNVVPVTCERGLYEESRAMRHCVYTYVHRCLAGTSRIFSIRREEVRWATFDLGSDGGYWSPGQVRGRENQRVRGHDIDIALETLRRYRLAWPRRNKTVCG